MCLSPRISKYICFTGRKGIILGYSSQKNNAPENKTTKDIPKHHDERARFTSAPLLPTPALRTTFPDVLFPAAVLFVELELHIQCPAVDRGFAS